MEKQLTITCSPTKIHLNQWVIYGFCLLLSAVFFFLFGFNSPIYTFNSDPDFNWFLTMGHGIVAGKLPYRDLFDHKGPITYMIFAFACLFQNPQFVIWCIEVLCMSLFFFFTYRIAKKYLNTFYSFVATSIMALVIFSSWCRIYSAATVEEFCLPIYAYFLLCWLEFILDKQSWHWVRALCLGLCFGILFWVKYTLLFFMVAPMVIWLIISLRSKQYRTILSNLVMMLTGAIIITLPVLIIFAINHTLSDLFHVYFVINLTAYGTTSIKTVIDSINKFLWIGPILLVFLFYGVIRFTIKYWRNRAGWLLLISFLVTLLLLAYSSKKIVYYFAELIPYAILGVVDVLILISNKVKLPRHHYWLLPIIILVCFLCTMPLSPYYIHELKRNRSDYAPLVIADEIHSYEAANHTSATLFCYRIFDFGFYNAAKITPNNYFFGNNFFNENRFPEMYQSFRRYITEQTSDFVITERKTWEQEQDFLGQYYQPYRADINTCTYHYNKLKYYYYVNYDFVLLIKKSS